MAKWWRSHPKLVGTCVYGAIKALSLLLRIHVHKDANIDPKQPYLFAFWHGKQLLPSLVMHRHHFTDLCTMASPSKDGALLTQYLQCSGFEVIRGSSRDKNISALIKMRRKIATGASMGFAVDGPLGPIYNIKPGVIYLAQKCNVPIIPIGSAFSKSWVFNRAWDKFQLPKPFSKAVLILDEPYVVTRDMDLETARKDLEYRLQDSERKAKDLL